MFLCGLVSSSAVAECALCFERVCMWRRARQAGACCHFLSPMATAIGRSDTDHAAVGWETAPTTAIERETAAIEREMAAIERETAAMERETAAIAREMAATDSDRARFGTGTTRERRDVALRSTRVEIGQDARSAWSVWSVPPLWWRQRRAHFHLATIGANNKTLLALLLLVRDDDELNINPPTPLQSQAWRDFSFFHAGRPAWGTILIPGGGESFFAETPNTQAKP